MSNEELLKSAEMLMRARAAYYEDGEYAAEFKDMYAGMAHAYKTAADILADVITDNSDLLNMKWSGYESYDPRTFKPFELWNWMHSTWPRVGDYFQVGQYYGKCMKFEVDYENCSATAWMRVEG